jgi:glycosyltransferase involved in cell wall biosynthesis
MYVACDENNVIMAVADTPITITGLTTHKFKEIPKKEWSKWIGKSLVEKRKKEADSLRIAFICNWNDPCGISTYSKYLLEAIRPKVKEIAVFSEIVTEPTSEDEEFVVRCWKRGESMKQAINQVLAWKPDFVIVQHEFGIFPKATFFLQMLQMLEKTPYIVTVHSVYEHLDKSVCTSAIKNIVVHSHQGEQVLRKLGNNSRVFVIPHGCVRYEEKDRTELWNIFHTPYALVQFGFGFFYKGVDVVLDAVAHLKTSQPDKYKDIFYLYLCSDNSHANHIHAQYYNFLLKKVEDLGIEDNTAIIRKFQSDQALNSYLRTAKIALFPYVINPHNTVYGASGALRVAMANGIPVIASNSHLFDDMEGVIPRPTNYIELAKEIDRIFSSHVHKESLLGRINNYIEQNTWPVTADRYLKLYNLL